LLIKQEQPQSKFLYQASPVKELLMPEGWSFRPSDLCNVEIFSILADEKILYIPELKSWVYYDGKKWVQDVQRVQVEKICTEVIKTLYAMSSAAIMENERKLYAAWALKTEDEGKRRAMVAGAERVQNLVKSITVFDKNNYLFNCNSGTIDLKTGELLPHSPDDYLMKLSPVNYDPDAECPLFMDTMTRALQGDTELISFLQKYFGYCFMYGKKGSNGKSTITTALFEVMAEYACKISFNTLLAGMNRQAGGASEDLARLAGVRFVVASEPPENAAFNDALLKDLTGGDPINARHLHSKSFDFIPQLKLCIFGNHKPRLRGSDGAVRRRMRLIHFNYSFKNSGEIKGYAEKLKEEYSGLLAWLVQGCLLWQEQGLQEPEAITTATDKYFYENDTLQQFFDENYTFDLSGSILFKDFYDSFCEYTGNNKMTKVKFSKIVQDDLELIVEAGAKNQKYVKNIRGKNELNFENVF
jgi:putative DNA primase/helicase